MRTRGRSLLPRRTSAWAATKACSSSSRARCRASPRTARSCWRPPPRSPRRPMATVASTADCTCRARWHTWTRRASSSCTPSRSTTPFAAWPTPCSRATASPTAPMWAPRCAGRWHPKRRWACCAARAAASPWWSTRTWRTRSRSCATTRASSPTAPATSASTSTPLISCVRSARPRRCRATTIWRARRSRTRTKRRALRCPRAS
mmetsp:Transcript_144637/g.351222  ORF Transcript_144637/g.351222 Transcript_144637/m.351222 type:complete len:205 (+) Transcript_144637:612-1226(+)